MRQFEDAFARCHGLVHGVACASGSAALHAAYASLRLAPGDEAEIEQRKIVKRSLDDMEQMMSKCEDLEEK